MSSPRYCNLTEPHDGHEWTQGWIDENDVGNRAYHYCWGVKPHAVFSILNESLSEAKAAVARYERALTEMAIVQRRTRDEHEARLNHEEADVDR